jgi:hypothetical protein
VSVFDFPPTEGPNDVPAALERAKQLHHVLCEVVKSQVGLSTARKGDLEKRLGWSAGAGGVEAEAADLARWLIPAAHDIKVQPCLGPWEDSEPPNALPSVRFALQQLPLRVGRLRRWVPISLN